MYRLTMQLVSLLITQIRFKCRATLNNLPHLSTLPQVAQREENVVSLRKVYTLVTNYDTYFIISKTN